MKKASIYFFFVFFLFFCFGGVGGGGGSGAKEKRGSMSFDLLYFFPKVIFYVIPYVGAFLLIQCFFK